MPDNILELDYLTPPGRRQGHEVPAPSIYKPPAPPLATPLATPTPATQQFYSDNFRGFQLRHHNVEREFQAGFQPSLADTVQRRGPAHPAHQPAPSSYDQKLILDLSPAPPPGLATPPGLAPPPGVMTPQHPHYHHQVPSSGQHTRTKTLQELTLAT